MKNIYLLLVFLSFFATQQAMIQLPSPQDTIPQEINMVDHLNSSPLYYAAKKGKEDIARCLLENKANPNLPTDSISPLCAAIQGYHVNIVRLLLDFKADPNSTKNERREAPLLLAIKKYEDAYYPEKKLNAKENIQSLLFCPNINKKIVNLRGQTPLHYAVENSDVEIVRLLLADDNTLKKSENNN
ncbi:ankyrin repeat domain-containing protein [Candidatus Dependentiae bacterium]|nr:MAG: ankyrin repeat domain-containing protein [Candidatus Dependentiae bacterium]